MRAHLGVLDDEGLELVLLQRHRVTAHDAPLPHTDSVLAVVKHVAAAVACEEAHEEVAEVRLTGRVARGDADSGACMREMRDVAQLLRNVVVHRVLAGGEARLVALDL